MWTLENRPKYNRDHLRYPSDLTDDEWAYIAPLIPPPRPHPLLRPRTRWLEFRRWLGRFGRVVEQENAG
jgi:hypothetical protein